MHIEKKINFKKKDEKLKLLITMVGNENNEIGLVVPLDQLG